MNLGTDCQSERGGLKWKEPPLEKDNRSGNMTSRRWVIHVTYLVTAVDITCLFMQFGIVPVSMAYLLQIQELPSYSLK